MLHRDLHRRVAREGHRPRQHLVEEDADGVEVGALVDPGAPRLFRREVLGGADDGAGLGHLADPGPGDAEVRHLQAPVRVGHHVVRLDVAVDDALAMREAERAEHLAGELDRVADRERPAGDDELLQAPPVEVLHRDVVGALGLAPVVDRDDVRVREAGGVLRLAAEALDERLVVRVAVVQDLDRNPAPELLVLGQVDVCHPARAELPDDPVAPVEERVDQGVDESHVLGHHQGSSTFTGEVLP